MRIKMGYPSPETEREILRKRVGVRGENPLDALEPVADVSEVLAMQDEVAHIKVDSSLHDYALEIVNRTRNSGTTQMIRARRIQGEITQIPAASVTVLMTC